MAKKRIEDTMAYQIGGKIGLYAAWIVGLLIYGVVVTGLLWIIVKLIQGIF